MRVKSVDYSIQEGYRLAGKGHLGSADSKMLAHPFHQLFLAARFCVGKDINAAHRMADHPLPLPRLNNEQLPCLRGQKLQIDFLH